MKNRSSYVTSALVPSALVAFVSLALAAGCEDAKDGTAGISDSKAGSAASDFTTRDTAGNTFHLSDHLGKEAILIDFWATWCQPCVAEMPHLQRMYDHQGEIRIVEAVVDVVGAERTAGSALR